ncbi:MAG: hypothetical protein ACMUHX_11425 [bacterium]
MNDGLKRINFFDGFFTQAEDWQSAQDYHLEKRRLHNQFMHTPGIVYGCLKDLKVTAMEKGSSFSVAPGYAIDGEGQDLYLPKSEEVPINLEEYNLPATVYIVIRYHEEKIDEREDEANPNHSDFAFIEEYPKIEITTKEPDNYSVIELARIHLTKDVLRIKNPREPASPDDNEIDERYRKAAGTRIGRIRLEDIGEVVKEGEISVAVSKDLTPSEKDTNVLLEKINVKDAHRFYLVSAYPIEEGWIIWRIKSIYKRDSVEYRLFFKNFSSESANVSYKVFRLY